MNLQTLALAAVDTGANDVYFIWGCILLGAALFLIALELFVPSGGLIGLLAGVAAISSVVAFYRYDSTWGLSVGLAYLVLGPILIIFMFKFWMNSSLGRAMILTGDVASSGGEAGSLTAEAARRGRLSDLKALVGAEGVTDTALRPVGTVRIAGQRIDALAESGVIEAGKPVVVVDVYDNQIKVRPV